MLISRTRLPIRVSGEQPERHPDSALETLFYHQEQVRLIHWREFSGARTAVILTMLVTVLSFITGLSTLSQEVLVLDGPLAEVLPDVTGVVRFAGVILSFLLGGLTFGLSRGKRLAWYLTIVVLPLVGTLPLLTLQATHIPLLLLIMVTFPIVVLNRDHFDQPLDLSSLQIAALSSIVGVLVYGTVGSYAIRDQFVGIETLSDAVYYVLVTIATVGYGDITPTSPEGKWFSLSIIIFGTGAFTAAIGALIVPAIEKRMASAFGNMTPSGLSLLEDHVLVLGYSDITESLLQELGDEREIVVITPDQDDAAMLDEEGINVLTADPTDVETLHDAHIEDASGVVVATRDDASDVLAILAARQANPDVVIVGAANEQHNVSNLESVGADYVISPMAIGGRLLGRSILENQPPESLLTEPGAVGDQADAEASDETAEETGETDSADDPDDTDDS